MNRAVPFGLRSSGPFLTITILLKTKVRFEKVNDDSGDANAELNRHTRRRAWFVYRNRQRLGDRSIGRTPENVRRLFGSSWMRHRKEFPADHLAPSRRSPLKEIRKCCGPCGEDNFHCSRKTVVLVD